MLFEVTGNFLDGRAKRNFCKEISSQNERVAVETLYALLGSQHKCKRRNILIEKVSSKEGN